MILKGNTHAHTTNSDGQKHPTEVIEAYYKLDYDFLFITDHNAIRNKKNKLRVENYKGMLVFWGTEESNASDIQQHATYVKGNTEKLRIINHPCRYKNTIEEVEKMAKRYEYHAVEITQHGKLYPLYLRVNLPHIASDDSHNHKMISDSYLIVESKKEPDSILVAIKQNKIKQCGIEFDTDFVEYRFKEASGIQ